ncbi:hypothetical protein AGDE_12164 [Angomonas deanei]|uniref:Uncharacterized protein n=1 Tax=Angomonas deanei TaxID=59799 RepID=A0A7G2CHF5_9TRYP|nr:hypothetical protein AGDE_12164 [Angomonas deanei]CAD2218344.1 hypothetical protein, conserved [Angomonas deanei]|eukprot:EPY24803.1 hypothetical protein AGDE_12164 [Angomonas deanei]
MFLRVRFLELVAQNMSHVRDESESKTFFKKLNQSLVNIISGEDNTPQLLSSALNCFGGFGPASIIQEQSFLAREASDILMQVALDTEAFDEPVRRTASEALNRLTQAALYPILEKLFYLISDSREVDDEEQLVKERRMAMNRIAKLVTSPALRTQWTEENQTNMVFTLVAAVMKSLNAEEFRQLMQSASRLPIVKEKHGAPLIEAFFKTCDLKSTRNLEAMTIVGQVLSPGVEFNFVEPLNAAGLLSKDVDLSSEHGVYHTRVLHLACQTATADNVEVLFRYVFAQLKKVVSANDIPASLSVLEALLLAAVVISAKNTKEPLKELDDDAFQASLSVLLEKVGEVEPLLSTR